uniref:Plasmid SOS inhibition protein B n=1 Tax=Escherichia coli TaxID=562 RepID=A0A7D5GH75_ECOLX|nr:hypothetical protein pE02162_KPC_00010 [Escherichia coli]
MRTILTPDVLKTMSCDEFEDWRDSGEDFRRELTHAVMRDLSCPENWDVNGEYRSEFGGFFPVQIRFTPSHGNYHIAGVQSWCHQSGVDGGVSCPPAVARSPSFVP